MGPILDSLRGGHVAFLQNFLEGKYSIWAGSGISREVLPLVPELMQLLVDTLYESADLADSTCPFLEVLRQVLGLAGLEEDCDLNDGPANWPMEELGRRLAGQYSTVLDIPVLTPAGRLDMVWDILEIPPRYADAGIQPDAEHVLIGLLYQEGIIDTVLTTNWDPLIEKAQESMVGGPADRMPVIACSDELDGVGHRFLFKAHGCARRALEDRNRYGPFLVGTESDINRWDQNAFFEPFAEKARDVLRARGALVVGLSVQDSNLKRVMLKAGDEREHPFPLDPPKVVFSAPDVNVLRRQILKTIYGATYDDHHQEIDGAACLPPCAKPLLGALYVETLLSKARLVAGLAADDAGFPAHFLPALSEAIDTFEQWLEEVTDEELDSSLRWTDLIAHLPRCLTRFLSLFRDHRAPGSPTLYEPIVNGNLAVIRGDNNLAGRQLHWVLLTLVAGLVGARAGYWSVDFGYAEDDPAAPAMMLDLGSGYFVRVFIGDRAAVARVGLEKSGVLDPDDLPGTVVIYPYEPPSRIPSRRSPTRSLPGSVKGKGEIWMLELILGVDTPEALAEALRDELYAVGAA